jgi:hypothetical protein
MSQPPAWQKQLDDTLAALRSALGANLHSAALYGSAARGDFVPGVSDLNLLLVLNESTPAAHSAVAGALQARAQVEPFVVGLPGLARTARAFPAKFSAIRRSSITVHGPDVLAALPHYPELERFAAEQALRNARLRLVYNYLRRSASPAAYTRFALGFLPALHTACNSALEVEGSAIPRGRQAQAELYAASFNCPADVLAELAQLKRSPKPLLSPAQVQDVHARLFALIMAALAWAEERWPV